MSQHAPAAHVLAILAPFRRICVYIAVTNLFVCGADELTVAIAFDKTVKNTEETPAL